MYVSCIYNLREIGENMMELYSGNLYWSKTLTSKFQFNQVADILIIGGRTLFTYILAMNGEV